MKPTSKMKEIEGFLASQIVDEDVYRNMTQFITAYKTISSDDV